MPLSRLRLRLAGGFALAFGAGLAVLAAVALGYLWRESNRRLDVRLDAVASGVAQAVARELRETPDSSFVYAARQVQAEWPRNGDAWIIADATGAPVAASDTAQDAPRVLRARTAHPERRFDVTLDGADLRVSADSGSLRLDASHAWRYGVLAFGSTEGIEGDTELLATTLGIAAPIIVLLSLAAGYLLARRALRPVNTLGDALAAVDPDDLSHRLPVASPPDEVSALALEFNRLLERLAAAQHRNRGFVREAAHQIRTPLTLVLGEAAHELAAADSTAPRMRATLQRIGTAAEQMRRRVDELFLLAEAEAGVRIELDEDVELDGLVLECADLMRARAAALGRSLALGTIDPAIVRGNAPLLREALLELLENGCRHGGASAPVTTELTACDGTVILTVRSAADGAESGTAQSRGLGLPIVAWIARGHGARFSAQREEGMHVARLVLTARPAPAVDGLPALAVRP